MDMHPSGLPHLVGPEGSPFPHTDYSHSFRCLPNNVADELPPKILDSLPISRANQHPLKLCTSPSSPRAAAARPPLRLRAEHPSSPREQLPSSPSRLLLAPATTSIATLPVLKDRQPPHLVVIASGTDVASEETVESPAVVNDKIVISTSED